MWGHTGKGDRVFMWGHTGQGDRVFMWGDTGKGDSVTIERDAERGDSIILGKATERGDSLSTGRGAERGDSLSTGRGAERGDSLSTGRGAERGDSLSTGRGAERGDSLSTGRGAEQGDSIILGKDTEGDSVFMGGYSGQGDTINMAGEGDNCGTLPRRVETEINEYKDVHRDIHPAESSDNKPEKAEFIKIEKQSAITEEKSMSTSGCSSEKSDFQDSTEGEEEEDTQSENLCMREYVVIRDYMAADATQLSLCFGDKVLLLSAVTQDWWWVKHNGICGYVPASYLHDALNDQEDTEVDDPWQDEEYYGSYKTLKLHLEMLSDVPRTTAYKEVILRNSSSLCGKHILDLGCGTGIISFFCAKLAQPEAVYAVEASEIAEQTRRLVKQNGISNLVHVIRQRAEELQLPTKVDILVSEWMGTCLLFEFMLESVLQARDRWLKEDGVMWPSTACIHLVPCSASKEYANKVLFWDNPYQLDFSLLKPLAAKEFFARPKPDYVLQPEDCLSEPCILLHLNLKTLQLAELEVRAILSNLH
ncbi:hypothetical protein XENTR_v10024493 [Xenopus tropicalis]|nr:hypothetical protein XENTR_v10024493 [Xenopus tropicalis]KAE8580629.1 hypothetical protein XENTR_v10024493 [Xenopus tropicalis]